MTETVPDPSHMDFLQGGGEMGARIRAHDWAATPLGPPDTWPQSLRSALSICLHSSFPTAIYWGDDFCLLYNDAWSHIPADRHPGALGRPAAIVWNDIWDVVGPQIEAVVSNGEGYSAYDQMLMLNRDGKPSETYWNYSFTPIRGENGRISGVFNQGHESTHRILSERRLEEESRRQRRMFEQAPGFITILQGPSHTFDFVNQAYLRLFGDRDFIGKTIYEAFPELDGQGYYDWLDQVYSSGERFVAAQTPILLSYPGAPAEQRFLDFIYEPLLDEAGRVTGIFCEGFDVTAAHLAHKALEVSEAALREESRTFATLNQINAQLAGDLDLERLVQTVTDAGVEMTGARYGAYFHNEFDESGQRLRLFTLSGASTKDFAQLSNPRATALFRPTVENSGVIRSGDISQDPRYGQAHPHYGMPAGHPPIRSYLAVSVVSRSGAVLGGLFYGHPEPDQFTERHETVMSALAAQAAIAIDNAKLFEAAAQANATLEHRVEERSKELTVAHHALRQAQKMEAIGQLTGGIAHDFNNLLAGIIGSLELIERRIAADRPQDMQRFIQAAQRSATRAATLTQRLLAFSRRQTLDPKPADVNHLVTSMEELITRTVGPSIQLEVLRGAALWPTKIDAVQLESALLNLAINARDAMPEGGDIIIETANEVRQDLPTTVGPGSGDYVRISVRDTGSGIDAAIIERIFDPFFTTKPTGQGTGLGLSMIHGFVNQSGGHVFAHSVPGAGSTFSLYLPRYLGDEVADDSNGEGQAGPAAGRETVVIIDDDATVRMLMAEALREEGYDVMEAVDGRTGLTALHSRTDAALLVTDVGLPGGMNGRQVADAARVAAPALKVLFVTGYAEHAVIGDGNLETGMAVVTKPFAIAHFVLKVRDLLDAE